MNAVAEPGEAAAWLAKAYEDLVIAATDVDDR